jgi:hypothetical protein
MTADPTGTSGLAGAQQPDLALVAKGGPKFMARLEQLADATDRHDAAFAKLEIGENAVAAFNKAQQKLAEAEALRTEAEALRNQAARAVAEAKANSKAAAVSADQIIAAANVRQRAADHRMKEAEVREQAAIAAIAKAEHSHAEAERVREDLKGRTDRLLREIAGATS